jgi:flavin reductase (DIM6/NTAB) family NADH-FMN oxidoreductase RutF
MEIKPDALSWKSVYKLLIGSVLPRPIGWISTINDQGQPNLAPFSFFNVVCANPPTVLFCPMVRSGDNQLKDTLQNIRETGEFVVNIVSGELVEKMNKTSVEAPYDVNEFDFAGLTPALSSSVTPPRVAESPIHFECKLNQIIDISQNPGGGSVVIGTVVHLHIDEGMLIGEDKIDLAKLNPIGRLAGNSYVRVTDIFDLERPPAWK